MDPFVYNLLLFKISLVLIVFGSLLESNLGRGILTLHTFL